MTAIATRHGVSLNDLIAANPQIRNPNQSEWGSRSIFPVRLRVSE